METNETTAAELFDQGLEQYQQGAPVPELIPLFIEVCDRSPKMAPAWSCLAWLYLLNDQPQKALKAAQKAVKIDPILPQARINLVLALLEAGEKGVREHVEVVQKACAIDPEIKASISENCADGLQRKPDWQNMKKVQQWMDLA